MSDFKMFGGCGLMGGLLGFGIPMIQELTMSSVIGWTALGVAGGIALPVVVLLFLAG